MDTDISSKFRFHPKNRSAISRYASALVSVAVATFARWLLTLDTTHIYSPFIIFYPAVVFSAWYGGVGPGLLAASLSSVLGTIFFTSQPNTFHNLEAGDFLQLILFIFVSLTICLLIGNLYQSLSENSEKTREIITSRGRIKNILESIQGCFFSLDEQERFIHINEDCKNYLSKPLEEFYGRNLWEAFEGWKGTDFEEKILQVKEQKTALEFKFYDSPRSKWFEVHMYPSSDGISVHLFDISSREEAEKALGESESRFQTMADQAPVMLWMSGRDTHFNYVNEPWLKFKGRRLDQELGEGWTEGIHPDDLNRYLETYLIAFNTRQVFRIEYRMRRADGQYRWLLNVGTPRFTGDRQFAGYFGSALDITSRVQEEKRQSTENKITQVLSKEISLHDAFLEILKIICGELDWEIGMYWEKNKTADLFQNKEHYSQGRLPAESFIEKSREMVLSLGAGLPGKIAADRKPVWIENVLEYHNFPRAPYAREAGLRSAFGFPICLGRDIFGVMEFYNPQIRELDPPMLNLFESIGGLIGQFIERKGAEEALRQSQQNLNLALESARMGYWAWDLKTNQISWSDNLAFLHGLSAGNLSGTFDSLLACIHQEDREFVQKTVLEALQNKSNYRIEFRTRWPDGSTHWIHGRGHVVCDETGGVVQLMGLGIDVSERKQAEKILEVAYDEMEKMVEERTAQLAKSNIALKNEILERKKVEKEILEISQKEQRRWGAQIHDDLCQNLTGIMLLTRAVGKTQEKIGKVDSQELKKVEALLNQTISQAKEMARGLYPVELEADSLMFALKDLARRTEEIFKIGCQFYCPIPILIDDNNLATHLYRIAQEAIHNAVKHGQAQKIDLHLIKEDKEMSLIIQDDGKGFSEEAKNSPGIGFQIMKYRARMINASLNVRGHDTHGTILTCSFSLPAKSLHTLSQPNKAVSQTA